MDKHLLLLLALLWGLSAVADEPLHIIELQWRSAEELLPILRPMAGERASVSGSGYTLFLRAPHQRLQELKAMVLELDRAPRQLMISVYQGRLDDAQRGDLAGTAADIPVRRVQTRGRGDLTQRIHVSEGQRAFIAVGKTQSLPPVVVPVGPHGTPIIAGAYRETLSGFLVRPRVSGDRINLEIDTARAGPGQLPEQQGSTTRVLVEPGRWVPLAESSETNQVRDDRPVRRHSTVSGEYSGIFVKVDVLR